MRHVEAPSDDVLRAYGDALFLLMRSPRHAGLGMGALRAAFEPPLALGQYRIFRFSGVPRAMLTYARLTRAAEARMLAGEALAPEEWRGGGRLWLVDAVAPYPGLPTKLGRWLRAPGNFAKSEFRFRRLDADGRTRRIAHVDFARPGDPLRLETA